MRVPNWLDPMAKTEWKRIRELIDLDSFADVDLKSLELYCQSYAKWKRCETALMKDGYTFKTVNGYEQQRPEVSISKDALSSMQTIAKELGFTPASRIRMSKNKAEASSGQSGSGYDEEMNDMIK